MTVASPPKGAPSGQWTERMLLSIANFRADYAAELHFSPSSSRPVLSFTWDERERMLVPDEIEASEIGKTLSGRMVRVLSRSYGSDMLVQRAMLDLEGWCRRRHVAPDKGAPEPLHDERGLLCPRIVHEVIVHGNGSGEHGIEEAWLPSLRDNFYCRLIRRAAELEDLEYEEAREFLAGALRRIELKMTLWRLGAA
jgi:hypothetical protein